MSEVDAIGDLVTGGLAGRAVEPKAGEVGADGHTHESACLNCGTALQGAFCNACGQHAHVHRTLGAFFHDLLHGVLHFEGKTWRTLPLLAWRPGELTRRYIEGERAKFVSPTALFLFSVFLMFAVIGMTDNLSLPDDAVVTSKIATNVVADEAKLAKLEAQLVSDKATGRTTPGLQEQVDALKKQVQVERDMAEAGVVKGAAIQIDDELPRPLAKAVRKATDNPELFFYKLKTSAYKWSWALVPLSVPFLWLLFPFSRRFRLYDHTVFVTYSLCFMTLLLCLAMLIGVTPLAPAAAWLTLVPPIHMYRQLRGAYGTSRASALVRTALLLFACTIVATGFIILLTGLGLFG